MLSSPALESRVLHPSTSISLRCSSPLLRVHHGQNPGALQRTNVGVPSLFNLSSSSHSTISETGTIPILCLPPIKSLPTQQECLAYAISHAQMLVATPSYACARTQLVVHSI